MKPEDEYTLLTVIDEKLWFYKSALEIASKNSKEFPNVDYREDITKYEYAIKEVQGIRELLEKIH